MSSPEKKARPEGWPRTDREWLDAITKFPEECRTQLDRLTGLTPGEVFTNATGACRYAQCDHATLADCRDHATRRYLDASKLLPSDVEYAVRAFNHAKIAHEEAQAAHVRSQHALSEAAKRLTEAQSNMECRLGVLGLRR